MDQSRVKFVWLDKLIVVGMVFVIILTFLGAIVEEWR